MKWAKRILIIVVVLVALIAGFLVISHEKRPQGEAGSAADALAKKVQEALGTDRWSEIGAVSFEYAGRHTILWDRTRGLARVDFGGKRAMYRHADMSGKAFDGGNEVTDAKKKEAIITEGHRWFINDTFWLNPFASLFDQNVTRALATDEDGQQGLLISYASGGVTPGDAYLWFAGPDGVPTKWKMWVSLIPVGGIGATWENWQELPGGAKVSTRHSGIVDFEIKNLKGGRTLAEVVPGEDPFLPMMAPTATTAPSSQPAR